MPLPNNHFKPQRNPLDLGFDHASPREERSPLEMGEEDLDPIELAPDLTEPKGEDREPEPSRITTFETNSVLVNRDQRKFKRPLGQDAGATRVRVFHTKLSDTAMSHLETMINDWIDDDPEVAVKFTSTTVGVVEGKRSEAHLIITVWY